MKCQTVHIRAASLKGEALSKINLYNLRINDFVLQFFTTAGLSVLNLKKLVYRLIKYKLKVSHNYSYLQVALLIKYKTGSATFEWTVG